MKLLPYSNIKSEKLGSLLFAARVGCLLGYCQLGICVMLCILNIIVISLPDKIISATGARIDEFGTDAMVMSSSGYGMAYGGLVIGILGIIFLLISGICAKISSN